MMNEHSRNVSDLDLLNHYRAEVRFENDLLLQRLNSLLTSQSFLRIAYASSMGASNGQWGEPFALLLPPALAFPGLVLLLLGRPGITAAQAAQEAWQRKERELLRRSPELSVCSFMPDEDGQREIDSRRSEGILFASRVPHALAVAWSLFAALPLCLYLAT